MFAQRAAISMRLRIQRVVRLTLPINHDSFYKDHGSWHTLQDSQNTAGKINGAMCPKTDFLTSNFALFKN